MAKPMKRRDKYFLEQIKKVKEDIGFFEYRDYCGFYAPTYKKYTINLLKVLVGEDGRIIWTQLPSRLPAQVPGSYLFIVPKGLNPANDFLAPWDLEKDDINTWKTRTLNDGRKLYLNKAIPGHTPNMKRMMAYIGDDNGVQESAFFMRYDLLEKVDETLSEISNANTASSGVEEEAIPKVEVIDDELEEQQRRLAMLGNVKQPVPQRRVSNRVEGTLASANAMQPSSSRMNPAPAMTSGYIRRSQVPVKRQEATTSKRSYEVLCDGEDTDSEGIPAIPSKKTPRRIEGEHFPNDPVPSSSRLNVITTRPVQLDDNTLFFNPIDDSNLNLPKEEVENLRTELYQKISNGTRHINDFLQTCLKGGPRLFMHEYIFTMNGKRGLYLPQVKNHKTVFHIDAKTVRDILKYGNDWLFPEIPTSLPAKAPGSYIMIVDQAAFEQDIHKQHIKDSLSPWAAKKSYLTNRNRHTFSVEVSGSPRSKDYGLKNIRHSHYLNEELKRKICFLVDGDRNPVSHFVIEYKIPVLEPGTQGLNSAALNLRNADVQQSMLKHMAFDIPLPKKTVFKPLLPRQVAAVAPLQSGQDVADEEVEEQPTTSRAAVANRAGPKPKRVRKSGDGPSSSKKSPQKKTQSWEQVINNFNVQMILVNAKKEEFQQEGLNGFVQTIDTRIAQMNQELDDLIEKSVTDLKKLQAILDKPYAEIKAAEDAAAARREAYQEEVRIKEERRVAQRAGPSHRF